MSESPRTGCLYCDYGDMELMRKNRYMEDNYVYCELRQAIIEVTEDCPSCVINHLEEKKQANMSFLIDRMSDALAKEGL